MQVAHEKYLASVKQRISDAKISQLAMAAPLESSGTTTPKPSTSTPVDTNKQTNSGEVASQKVGLVHALLAVGALRPAFAVLSRYPWLVDAAPEIADVILRILRALRGIMQISVIVHEHVHLLTRLARQPNRYDLMRER